MEPIGELDSVQHPLHMFALVFVIFDVETVFLYPWAVAFTPRIGGSCFIAILVTLVYAWRKGALEWS